MVSERKSSTDLADPATALVSYLDDLLHTATTSATDTVEEAVTPEPEVLEPEVPEVSALEESAPQPVESVRSLADEALAPDLPDREPDPEPEPEPPAVVTDSPVAEPAETIAAAQEPPAPEQPEGKPDWADRPFECLIFRVAGLQLAVPLVLLGAIHRIEDRIKPIPGRPPWYMGMLLDRGQNLKVVDSAEWIMSGRVPEGAQDGYRFVIRLDDSDWALACDEVAESFTLDPDQVRWRTSRSKRPWLAGTVVKHMCALIDVGAMARLLARAEREHHLELD